MCSDRVDCAVVNVVLVLVVCAVPSSLKRAGAFTDTGKQSHGRRRRRRPASSPAVLSRAQQRFHVTFSSLSRHRIYLLYVRGNSCKLVLCRQFCRFHLSFSMANYQRAYSVCVFKQSWCSSRVDFSCVLLCATSNPLVIIETYTSRLRDGLLSNYLKC